MSIIPGERAVTGEELRTIRGMRDAGHSLEVIAAAWPDLAETHDAVVLRLAAMLAPKRPAAKKVWKGKRR